MSIINIVEGIYQCTDCGSHADLEDNVKHRKSCKPTEESCTCHISFSDVTLDNWMYYQMCNYCKKECLVILESWVDKIKNQPIKGN